MSDQEYHPFIQEMLPYIVYDPLVSNRPGEQPDGNAVLYCGIAMVIKCIYSKLDEGDFAWFSAVYRDCRKSRGLLTRGSHKANDYESHDDYIGFCAGAQLAHDTWAAEVLGYGATHGWVYDNSGISGTLSGWIRTWHVRFPGQVQHYKLCARRPLGLLDRIWWAIGMVSLGASESGYQKRWLKYRAYKNQDLRYWLCDMAAAMWENGLRKRYPNLMGDVFAIYFKDTNHPFARWMQGRA